MIFIREFEMNPYKLIWLILAIIVVGFELFTNFTGKPTLTDVTVEYMPWWIIMPFLSWLWLHFASIYNFPKWVRKIFNP